MFRASLSVCQQPARVVTVILATMPACLAWIVLDATRRKAGLLNITARTPALQMKAEEALIMAVHPAAIVTHRHCIPRLAQNAMTVTILMVKVVEGKIRLP
mgnify:CR=1 FL=1